MTTKVARPVGPTIEEIRGWPATVSVEDGARALGISRAHAYESIKLGTFPGRTLRVGNTLRVITGSILAVLDPGNV
jgi:predicted DNA-binding transcriptional regulator AlpA